MATRWKQGFRNERPLSSTVPGRLLSVLSHSAFLYCNKQHDRGDISEAKL